MSPELSLFDETPSAPLAIVATPGAQKLAELIDKRLVALYNSSAPKNARIKKGSFLVEAKCPRFTNGDAKGMILKSLRGKDLGRNGLKRAADVERELSGSGNDGAGIGGVVGAEEES